MTAPILQSVWSRRFLFLGVMGLTFAVLATAIFVMPKRVQIRSSIEIGTAVEAPDLVARRITGVYAPATLLAIAGKAKNPSVLASLQNPIVEGYGGSVLIVNTIPPHFESDAKAFQESITDRVMEDLAPRARALRENIASRIALGTKTSEELERQVKDTAREIERVDTFTSNLQRQLEPPQANLATRDPSASQTDEINADRARARELRETISNQWTLAGKLALERSRLVRDLTTAEREHSAQMATLVAAQFEQSNFKEPQVSQIPTVMPVTNVWDRPSSLVIALAMSILTAFGSVVLVQNITERRT
ncbi:hypothetical protein [Bradyrhizobium sp. 62]|uniref:hypothetical protein n=1 Tax=Bradyrhizobium sp. 62 TaxID=1043588 RepID=UPI001FFAACA2|nr:hypothetical protein [Bradyrhizobium sp. 62]MCK1364157.1 hypothetical protein [Bradyrhizobium sp. 62]